ncbi:hypothetical protein HWC09_gp155 [Lactobacillus phage 3-521]|uniref:Uncharacterized protein n=1 Tax=Lactobacillus phage 3-521 TaxID=2510943 RepID=A0A4Y5FHR5_9CAUD|nr:hypothetical protein HWC09_gp155 [Lactobacillus phage 3-521]QBJ03564.1 hypothetical protein UCC3521_0026 [Lactobacillus phage 3-521]
MSVIQGNTIFVINHMGVIFGVAHSLDVTREYGQQGIYNISDERDLEKGYTKVNSHVTATLHDLSLDFGEISDIHAIRVENVSGSKTDYLVVGKKIKGDDITFPVSQGTL